jgi:hypothetical protein
MTAMSKHASKRNRSWFLFAIAIPAAVEVWACWVGLGSLCGFPVIGLGRLHLPTDWTLAVGVEAYGTYALNVWLGSAPGPRSRKFAQWSALGAFTLSLAGQIAYHLMLAGKIKQAPAIVVVFVSCLVVAVIAFAAILTHLMRADERDGIRAGEDRVLQAALDAERAARLEAEADRDTARQELAGTTAREAALARQLEERQGGTVPPPVPPKPARRKSASAAPKNAKGPEAQAAEVLTRAEAELILAAEPGISGSELGRRLGVQEGYGRKLRRELTKSTPGGGQ